MEALISSKEFVKQTSKLKNNSFLSDATLHLDDGTLFKVHQILLAVGSSFFDSLFGFNQGPDYYLHEVPRDALDQILNWMYKHKMKLTHESVPEVLKVAHYLDCFEVVDQCSQYLLKEVSTDNVIGFWQFCRIFNILELQSKFFRYISYHYSDLVDGEEFANLPVEDLELLMKCNHLNTSEKVVLEAMIRWMSQDRKQRLKHIPRLIRHIRLGRIGRSYFEVNVLERAEIVSSFKYDHGLVEVLQGVQAVYEGKRELVRGSSEAHYWIPRLSQDIVLIVGGWCDGNASGVIESYDLRAARSTVLPTQRRSSASLDLKDPLGERGYLGAATIGSKVYLVGGTNGVRHFNDTSCIDLVTKQGKVLGPMNSPRCYVCLVTLDGFLYACGGFDGTKRLSTMERFEPSKNQWTQMAKMKSVRSDASCAVLNGKIYVVGGFDGHTQLDTVECYNPKTDKWTQVPKLSTKRSGVVCTAFRGELYVLGGFDGNRRLKTCEKYNVKTKRWIPIADMITPRSNFTAAVVDGRIMVFGGFDGYTTTEKVEKFELWKNNWIKCHDIEVARSALAATVVSGKELKRSTLKHFAYPNRKHLNEERPWYLGVLTSEDDEGDSYDEDDDILNSSEESGFVFDDGNNDDDDFEYEDDADDDQDASFSSSSDDMVNVNLGINVFPFLNVPFLNDDLDDFNEDLGQRRL